MQLPNAPLCPGEQLKAEVQMDEKRLLQQCSLSTARENSAMKFLIKFRHGCLYALNNRLQVFHPPIVFFRKRCNLFLRFSTVRHNNDSVLLQADLCCAVFLNNRSEALLKEGPRGPHAEHQFVPYRKQDRQGHCWKLLFFVPIPRTKNIDENIYFHIEPAISYRRR